MIVKREYVRLGKLFETDKEAEAVFIRAASNSYHEDDRDRIVNSLLKFSLSEREMGWCLHDMGTIIDCFERLDQERPYDSGMQPHEACQAKVIAWGRKSVVVKLLSRDGETIGVKRIHD